VQRLREVGADVLIVMVSGMDRKAEALAAGANAFLHYDEWLRIGSLVESLLHDRQRPPAEASDVAQRLGTVERTSTADITFGAVGKTPNGIPE
jgi:hypothetical protein